MTEDKARPAWLYEGVQAVPWDKTVRVPLTVTGGADHPGAVVVALRAQRVVAAYRHWDDLGDVAVDELADVLRDAVRLATQANALAETLILRMRDRDESTRASWAAIGDALGTTRAAARERYQRIHAAAELGMTAAWMRDQDDAVRIELDTLRGEQ